METDQKNHADNESGKHQDAKSDTAVEQVILRRDGTIAFRGIAASREELFLRQVRSYRGKGSLAQSTAFQKLNLDGFRFHVLEVNGLNLSGSSMRDMRATELQANRATLEDCDMTEARFPLRGSKISIKNSVLTRAVFDNSEVHRLDMSDCEITRMSMVEAKLTDPLMMRVQGNEPRFRRATLIRPDLSGATVICGDFRSATLDSREISVPEYSALTYLARKETACSAKATIISGLYDKETSILGGFPQMVWDKRISSLIRFGITSAAAIATSLVVETAVEKTGVGTMLHHLGDTHMGMAIGLIAGVALLRETAADEMKGAFRANMDRLWTAMREKTRGIVRAGVDLGSVVWAYGTRRGIRNYYRAMLADGKRPTFINAIGNVMRGKKAIHFLACDKDSAARAIECLTRQYHQIGDGKQLSLLMPSGVGTPTVLNLLPNGGYSAVWMNEANDRLTPDAIISYDRYGTIQEAYDGKGFSMSEGAISDLRAKTGQGVLRDMVKAVIAMSDYAKAGMSFDLGASYATRMTDGGMAVRSIHANRISNAYGPALHPKEGGGLYFKGGKLVSADEGVATAIQYRERTSPEMLVGEETMTAPASIPVYQHHAKRGREFIDYATLEQAMAEKANDPQKAARVTQDKPSPSPSGPSPS